MCLELEVHGVYPTCITLIIFIYDMLTNFPAGKFATVAEGYTARLFQMGETAHHNFFLTDAFAIGC